MYYQKDWILRQIEMLTQLVARLVFCKDQITYEIQDKGSSSQTDLLYLRLQKLVVEKKFCGAEDLLFENLDSHDLEYLRLAMDFYQTLNKFSDDELEKNNFSREEIFDGMNDVVKRFQIPTIEI